LQRQALVEKSEKVKEIRKIVQRYKCLGIANLTKVRASQLQETRKKLEGTAYLSVIKNSLMRKAIEGIEEKPHIDELEKYVKGQTLFIFTNVNPFRLVSTLQKSKMKDFAKAGDIATEDVVVPAGNTALQPGPIISQLGSVGIPTRIESGSVWVNRDTVVAKKGDTISESLAPVLSKLNIKPIEMGLSFKVVYDEGSIIPEEKLSLRLEEYEDDIGAAYAEALNLSLNAAYPMAETISILIQIASTQAHSLALNASIPSAETIGDLIRKAYSEAAALEAKIQTKPEAK
jgi:large subunit ribosomal protein L10